MKKVIIIGTGAHASEIVDYIDDNNKHSAFDDKYKIIGFLEYEYNRENYYNKYGFTAPILGDIENYLPSDDEFFILGVADIIFRQKILKIVLSKSYKFTNFIHHSCIVSRNLQLGVGNVICPGCIIGSNVKIGDFNMLNCHATISHDCIVGNNNIFSSYSGTAGHVTIDNNNMFSLHSAIIPNLSVGSNNIIQAGMVVDKNIENDSVIFHRFKEKVLLVKQKMND